MCDSDSKSAFGYNPGLIDRHELLVHIVNEHKDWSQREHRYRGRAKGIALGNMMALEQLHWWVKHWTPQCSTVDSSCERPDDTRIDELSEEITP